MFIIVIKFINKFVVFYIVFVFIIVLIKISIIIRYLKINNIIWFVDKNLILDWL